MPAVDAGGAVLSGMVLLVDRFGNLVTNIDRRTFEAFAKQGPIRIVVGGPGGQPVDRLVSTYAEIGPGEVCALFGSSDHLELAANAESAAEKLRLGRKAVVEIVAGSVGLTEVGAGSPEGRSTELSSARRTSDPPASRPATSSAPC